MIDEKAIYEWLYGVKVEKRSNGYCGLYVDEMDRPFWLRLPSLDMNTAHGECIPKLREEGVAVMYNNMDSHEWWLDPVGNVRDPFTNSDFYVALTEYLKEEVK